MVGDYSSTGGGLKLKGAKPKGVEKKRKKKTSSSTTKTDSSASQEQQDIDPSVTLDGDEKEGKEALTKAGDAERAARNELEMMHKTEAERRHEEIRRKRLNDRLAREGSKTHKERVEELNKYLSGLSEHHDMYVFACVGIYVYQHCADALLIGHALDLVKPGRVQLKHNEKLAKSSKIAGL